MLWIGVWCHHCSRCLMLTHVGPTARQWWWIGASWDVSLSLLHPLPCLTALPLGRVAGGSQWAPGGLWGSPTWPAPLLVPCPNPPDKAAAGGPGSHTVSGDGPFSSLTTPVCWILRLLSFNNPPPPGVCQASRCPCYSWLEAPSTTLEWWHVEPWLPWHHLWNTWTLFWGWPDNCLILRTPAATTACTGSCCRWVQSWGGRWLQSGMCGEEQGAFMSNVLTFVF